jgi:hypothetical protein
VGQIANYEYENFHGSAVESVRDEDGKKNYVAFGALAGSGSERSGNVRAECTPFPIPFSSPMLQNNPTI